MIKQNYLIFVSEVSLISALSQFVSFTIWERTEREMGKIESHQLFVAAMMYVTTGTNCKRNYMASSMRERN